MAEKPQSDHIWDSSGQITSTGSADAYIVTIAEQINGYYQGMPPIRFKASFGNTGPATVNICTQTAPAGLGAVALRRVGGSALASGEIISGGMYTIMYDDTVFQVLELAGSISNGQLADMAEGTIKGRASGAGTGDPQDLTGIQAANIVAVASETQQGVAEMATNAEIRSAATGAKAIMAEDLETAAAFVALTDAAPVAVDWDTGINFSLTVAANRQIGNPTNGQPGTFRNILVQGNDATDRTITFGAQFLGDVPTITDCDSTRWYLLSIMCITASHFVASSKKALGT